MAMDDAILIVINYWTLSLDFGMMRGIDYSFSLDVDFRNILEWTRKIICKTC